MKEEKPYVYQEFPKWKYHVDGQSKIVQNAEEEKALGKGWYNNPGEVAKALEPSRIDVILNKKVRSWWTKWEWIVVGLAAIVGLLVGLKTLLK